MPDTIRAENGTARATVAAGNVRLTITDSRNAAGLELTPNQATALARLLLAQSYVAEHG